MNWDKNENPSHEFSFKKLHENLISNVGIDTTFSDGRKSGSCKKLKFEPNLNVMRRISKCLIVTLATGSEAKPIMKERSLSFNQEKAIVTNQVKESLTENSKTKK